LQCNTKLSLKKTQQASDRFKVPQLKYQELTMFYTYLITRFINRSSSAVSTRSAKK